jgi:transposase
VRAAAPAAAAAEGRASAVDRRKAVGAIFWILDNGAKLKDLLAHFGSKSAMHAYFQRWTPQGVFEKTLCVTRTSSSRNAAATAGTTARHGTMLKERSANA